MRLYSNFAWQTYIFSSSMWTFMKQLLQIINDLDFDLYAKNSFYRLCCCWGHLSIESHFVGVHALYELHRKEEQIKCTALAVHENLLFFPMQFIWPVNTDKMRFNTYIYIFLQKNLSRYCLL